MQFAAADPPPALSLVWENLNHEPTGADAKVTARRPAGHGHFKSSVFPELAATATSNGPHHLAPVRNERRDRPCDEYEGDAGRLVQ